MKIGILGFGFMGGIHLSAIERIEGVALTAVSSRTKPTPDKPSRGNLHHIESSTLPTDIDWYTDWQQLLLDPNIDAVVICLPTYLHKPAILSALARGKHVLCEKPMALTPADCDEILEAAERSGRVFMVAHVLRFTFPYRYADSFVSSMSHGVVKACTMRRKTGFPQWSEWLAKEEYSGGAILDLLVHDIDQAINMFGTPGTVGAVSGGEIDTVCGVLRYSKGLTVRIEGGWYAPDIPFSTSFQITSQDAALSYDEGKLRLVLSDREEIIDVPEPLEYFEQMTYFVECCRKNMAPELCLPTESAQAVRIAALLKASRAQNGRELLCGI